MPSDRPRRPAARELRGRAAKARRQPGRERQPFERAVAAQARPEQVRVEPGALDRAAADARPRPDASRDGGRRAAAPSRLRRGVEAPGARRPEPRTEAERRAAEVRARRAPRKPIDPDLERQQDRGSARPSNGSTRVRSGPRPRRRPSGRPRRRPRRDPELDPEVLAEIHVATADTRRAPTRLAERLTSASAALDRERFDDARRMVAPVIRELPQLAAGHELNGLATYRHRALAGGGGVARAGAPAAPRPGAAARAGRLLPGAQALDRRSMPRGARSVRLSPSHEVMAEGRIVVAGALRRSRRSASRRSLLMQPAQKPPKRSASTTCGSGTCSADLLDRAGDTVGATRWFRRCSPTTPTSPTSRDRLRALGR